MAGSDRSDGFKLQNSANNLDKIIFRWDQRTTLRRRGLTKFFFLVHPVNNNSHILLNVQSKLSKLSKDEVFIVKLR